MHLSPIPVGRHMVLPMEPDTHRLLRDGNYESGDYYGLVASLLLECGFLEPHGPEAQMVARFLRDDGGLLLGISEFAGGIDHAYGYGYLLHVLENGEPERYLLGLYTSLAYGMSRETFSSVECTALKTGENALTLPHLYSGAQQLFMLRTMLLREDGRDLVLCSATPRAWLEPGKSIRVSGAPTRFGPVSFEVRSGPRAEVITAEITPPRRQRPERIILHLRHPAGKRIASVTVDGRPWREFDGERVFLPARDRPLALQAAYEP